MQEHMNKRQQLFSHLVQRGGDQTKLAERQEQRVEESKELLPADHDAFVGPRSPPIARGGGARAGMERGLSRREKARRGGGRKEERGGTEESKGEEPRR